MSSKDLWANARSGTVHDVEAALILLKRNNGNVDARNAFGSTALHIAVWRNHVPIVRSLLAAGANPDVRDGESGWSSLHRALHFGHLAIAGVLIEAGASLLLEDSKGRTPVDLLSGPVSQVIADENNAGATEVFSWGNGANYQLGTGTAGIQKVPCRVDAFQGLYVTAVAAAKFHSVAVTAGGELYSWGFGRGGRLGHADFDIHSGQVAVITPRLVSNGLGSRRVKVVAAAKHHTIVATVGGEVFTWGSNREGQLGYPSIDTQPTPRRVSSLKARVVAVAAANKHSALLTAEGEVYTWGCNKEGQLGYGTSNSASNYNPRIVDYLKGKRFIAVSAAKYHTIVLGSEGEVFTWGYKMVMPRRVLITRNTKISGTIPMKFHRAERLHIVTIAAGTMHSTALSEDGLIFYWMSSDPYLHCHQLLSISRNQAVAVAAGKYRTAVVTASGDVYVWDGEGVKGNALPVPFRVHGIKHATCISVAENHSLVAAAVYLPKFPPKHTSETNPVTGAVSKDLDESDEVPDVDDSSLVWLHSKSKVCLETEKQPWCIPSLKDICQRVMVEYVVEPKNALHLLEIADSLGAHDLRKHCEDLVLHNLDYLLTISPVSFSNVRPSLLADVEKALDASSSQAWSNRRLPTPTATFPATVDSEDDSETVKFSQTRSISSMDNVNSGTGEIFEGLFRQENEVDRAAVKHLRALRKKLQQIEALELKQAKGHYLDVQQLAKLQSKQAVEEAIAALDPTIALQSEIGICRSETKALDSFCASMSVAEESITAGKVVSSRHKRSTLKKCKLLEERMQLDELDEKKSKGGRMSNALNKKMQIASEGLLIKRGGEAFYPFKEEKVQSYNDGRAYPTNDSKNCDFAAVSQKKSSITNSFVLGIGNPGDGPSECSLKDKDSEAAAKSAKKRNKKGGLSVSINEALDDTPHLAMHNSPLPKADVPAWGGVHIKKGMSLREIQSQQTFELNTAVAEVNSSGKTMDKKHLSVARNKTLEANGQLVDEECSSRTRIPLSQFVRSSAPIAFTPVKATKVVLGTNLGSSPPPWAGTSPIASAASFKDIQMQQVKHKSQQRHGALQGNPQGDSLIDSLTSPARSASAVSEHAAGSPTEQTNCWFKPEITKPSSIRCIQIEEKAMKELRHFYKNVKLVQNDNT